MTREKIQQHHFRDMHGKPAGGQTYGLGLAIAWQHGPIPANGRNGAFVEDAIEAAMGRLEFFQDSEFPCEENADALMYLQKALDVLENRTRTRIERGVDGTYTA